jgi:hypothetical protein
MHLLLRWTGAAALAATGCSASIGNRLASCEDGVGCRQGSTDLGPDAASPPLADAAPALDAGVPATSDAAGGQLQPCQQRYRDVLFCDDFEADLSGWDNTYTTSNVSVALTDTHAVHGVRSLAIAQQGAATTDHSAALLFATTGTLTSGPLFVRGMFLLPASTTISQWTGLLKLENGISAGAEAVTVALEPGPDLHLSNTTASPGSDLEASASVNIDRWTCIELEVTIASADQGGRLGLRVDGDLVAQMGPGVSAVPGDGYDRLWFGIWQGAEQTGTRLWLDSVVVARSPIGCD